jgi:three-Cys-motif partner protein
MKNGKFFDERGDQSVIKARIVSKYFFAWANVVMQTARKLGGKISYIDLYAGPGRYKDGSASTPLMILEKAIANPTFASTLVAYFNDSEENNVSTLREEIAKLPGIERLKHPPIIECGEIDEEVAKHFNSSFIDPFGYKGLSLNIVKGVIKDWGCDCVFFFNYNRINAGISNPAVEKHMIQLFGEARVQQLKMRLPDLSPELREAAILEELSAELRRLGATFVLPFTFKNAAGTRTTHKLIFVTKHFKGYEIMKDIMFAESSTQDQGVASFAYSPADASMPLLFSLARPADELKSELLTLFAGKSKSFETLYVEHSVDTPYVRKNYRAALTELENEGAVQVNTLKAGRRPGTFAEHVTIKFPSLK